MVDLAGNAGTINIPGKTGRVLSWAIEEVIAAEPMTLADNRRSYVPPAASYTGIMEVISGASNPIAVGDVGEATLRVAQEPGFSYTCKQVIVTDIGQVSIHDGEVRTTIMFQGGWPLYEASYAPSSSAYIAGASQYQDEFETEMFENVGVPERVLSTVPLLRPVPPRPESTHSIPRGKKTPPVLETEETVPEVKATDRFDLIDISDEERNNEN